MMSSIRNNTTESTMWVRGQNSVLQGKDVLVHNLDVKINRVLSNTLQPLNEQKKKLPC